MIQTKKEVIEFERKLNGIRREVEHFTENHFNEQIEQSWERLKFIAAKERLKAMPVDTISTLESGMPINRLVNQGFKTIYDIRNESVEDLQRIDGVGIISAPLIYEAASKIITAVYEEVKPKLNPDHLSEDDLMVLESIYRKWKLTEVVQPLEAMIEMLVQEVGSNIKIAKGKKGFFGSIFQSKDEKENVNDAIEALNQRKHHENLHKAQKQLVHIQQFSVEPDQLRSHFIEKMPAIILRLKR